MSTVIVLALALAIAAYAAVRRAVADEARAREILEAVGCEVPAEVPTRCVLEHAYDESEPSMTECGVVCRFALWLLLALGAAGCANPCYVLQVRGGYAITAPTVTAKGIVEQGADPVLLDRLTDEVEACLQQLHPWPFKCGSLPIDRRSFRVLIATDYVQLDDGEQVLPTHIYRGDAGCEAKGLNGPGPCRWRAFLQPDNLIVATPNLKLYKDPLLRMLTGHQEIWTSPELARCAM